MNRRWSLPIDVGSALRARSTTRRFLAAQGESPGSQETAALVVSELVSNAVAHAAARPGPIRLEVEASGGVIHIAVSDHDPTPPRPPSDPGGRDERGRGLLIIERMSARWGRAPLAGDGKTGVVRRE